MLPLLGLFVVKLESLSSDIDHATPIFVHESRAVWIRPQLGREEVSARTEPIPSTSSVLNEWESLERIIGTASSKVSPISAPPPSSSPWLKSLLMTTSKPSGTSRWLLTTLSHCGWTTHHHICHLTWIRHSLHLHKFHHLLHLGLRRHTWHVRCSNSGHGRHSRHRHSCSRVIEESLHLFRLLVDCFYFSWHRLLLQAIACPGEFVESIVEVIRYVCAWLPPWFCRVREIGVKISIEYWLACAWVNRVSICWI